MPHFLELSSGWVRFPDLYSPVSQNKNTDFFLKLIFINTRQVQSWPRGFGTLSFFRVLLLEFQLARNTDSLTQPYQDFSPTYPAPR